MATKTATKRQTTAITMNVPKPVTGYKVLTHDLRSPIQGGEPLFDGTCPFTTPVTALDVSEQECAPGWNFCRDGATALRIGGFWPNGRSSRVFAVTAADDVVHRGDKSRASALTLTQEMAEEGEIEQLIREFSAPLFTDVDALEQMVREQRAWRWVLGAGFGTKEAVQVRTLAWDARDARGARGARDARGAWGARDARGARGARDAWGAWGARGARDARGAWGAWGACTVYYVCVLRQWRALPPSYKWLADGGGVQGIVKTAMAKGCV